MKHVRAIIWDLDKTLYPFDEAFGIASQRALVKMMTALKPELTVAQATACAEPTYPMKTIAKLQFSFGLNPKEMFDRYYSYLDAGFLRPSPDFLQEMKEGPAPASASASSLTVTATGPTGRLSSLASPLSSPPITGLPTKTFLARTKMRALARSGSS